MADDTLGGSVLILTAINVAMSWTRIFMCVLIKGIQVPIKVLDLKHWPTLLWSYIPMWAMCFEGVA
jgi:hypothetical protein